jgi:hypothetical protein
VSQIRPSRPREYGEDGYTRRTSGPLHIAQKDAGSA